MRRKNCLSAKSLQRKNKRRRQTWAIIIAVIVGLASLGFFAYLQQNEALLQAELAKAEEERAEKEIQLRTKAEAETERANQERDRANTQTTIAQQERDRADQFRAEAEQARLNLANANDFFMEDLLSNANRNIALATFQQAFGNLRTASDFGISAQSLQIDHNLAADWRERTNHYLLETAYFFAESGKPDFILLNADDLFRFSWEPPNMITYFNDYLGQKRHAR